MSYEVKIHLCDKQKLTKNNTFYDVVSSIDLRDIGTSNAVAKYINDESKKSTTIMMYIYLLPTIQQEYLKICTATHYGKSVLRNFSNT